MKTTMRIALAAWLLEHWAGGPANEGLVGDLLEQWRQGRSAAWFWRQAATAMAIRSGESALRWLPAAAFAAGWSLLYPAWRSMSSGWLPHDVPQHWLALAWPRPQILELACGVAPAVSFVWFGALVYLVVRRDHLRSMTAWRAVGALSASLNVLLVSAMAMLQFSAHSDLANVTHPNFFAGCQFMGISLSPALSVLAALYAARPRGPRGARGKRAAGAGGSRKIAHLTQSFGRGASYCVAAGPVVAAR